MVNVFKHVIKICTLQNILSFKYDAVVVLGCSDGCRFVHYFCFIVLYQCCKSVSIEIVQWIWGTCSLTVIIYL